MLKKYSLWDKQSPVITPSGEIFTADQWIERYPIAALENIHIVGAAGVINGGIFGVLEQMIAEAQSQGCEFDEGLTPLECLERIEEFEEEIEAEMQIKMQEDKLAEEQALMESIIENQRIADALEDLVVLQMPDIEEE